MSERIHAHQLYQPILYPNHRQQKKVDQSFQSVLHKEFKNQLTVSKHAQKRLLDRNITISETSWNKISEKVIEARQKGIKDSLVIMKNVTLVVNTSNQTVITALDRNESTSQIFTNINGAIVIDE
ncbi:TIGR02530 family flagellar biosynthesis protein [Fictibacillus nanhaiensis]|uniref:TIGR02530 family flagellar biosynthesis protein n=1 Tax=Fictibacillus nanhaiensis TaxID=742169 RepID=UPI002E23F1AF|nr:TIGR02530 family flagellar biosynthesis protein [Fictibacillus nanhaiensis]MED1864230.1 TIGR02530 family flagellar biosynthesis protein [Fictibacillus nanhaiensis]